MSRQTIVLDIDTQCDFLLPDGAWPLPGASKITPSLERVSRYASMYKLPLLATTQVLDAANPLFEANGGTAPAHCVKGTPGQLKAPATLLENAHVVGAENCPDAEIQRLMGLQTIILETSGPDLLSNPNTERLLSGVKNAIVYGVTAEGALLRAVQVLLNKGIAVEFVQNATTGRSEDPEALEKVLAEMVTLGAKKIRDIDIMTRFTTSRHH